MTVISSEEINYLIYRYLQEAGFLHSSFSFAHESLIYKSDIVAEAVPPGALVTMLQKALHYIEIETHLNDDGSAKQCDKPFHLLEQHICQSSSKSKYQHSSNGDELDTHKLSATLISSSHDKSKKRYHAEKRKRESKTEDEEEHELDLVDISDGISISHEQQLEETLYREILQGEIYTFSRHTKDVFMCSWHPKNADILASASGDGFAYILNLIDVSKTEQEAIALDHRSGIEKNPADVTMLDWHSTGEYLATADNTGSVRVWEENGELVHHLAAHKQPVFALKWNKRGNYLLSGSFDKTTIIWDAHNGEIRQRFNFHSGPVLDIDWKNNTTFASSSYDKTILVCKLNEERPLKTFVGHNEDINVIKWDPSYTILASGSDDKTAKIWSMNQDHCIYDLIGHQKAIYALEWSPTESTNPDLILATASFDKTVKLWDVHTGQCTNTLSKHTGPIYSLAYSPQGHFIATGSSDKTVNIWSTKNGHIIRSYTDTSGIYDVCWNHAGNRIAISTDNHKAIIIDLRK